MATLLLTSNCGAPFSGQPGVGGGGAFLRNNHHRSTSDNNQDSDYAIINLPLQCDVTIVPRITIPNNNNNNNVPTSSSSTIHKLHTLKVPNQVLNPCGINNIISIDNQELFNTNEEGEDNDNGNGANYLLSLTHCAVNIDNDNSSNITSLPITSNPSTFQFTFYKEKNDKESLWGENNNVVDDDVDTVFYTNGKVHRVGEIHTSFDYTTAIEYYQENVRNKKNQQQKNNEVCNKLHNNNSTTIHNTKRSNPEVASIMVSLEEESRFVKQTLTVLGCLGVVFTVALVWTLSKMSSTTKKKVRRRRVIVNDSWRYSVPREVVDTGKDDSVKTDEGHVTPLVDNVSPLSTVMNADEQPTDLAAVTTSNEESKANHETLHLVSPFTPLQSAGAAAKDAKKDNGTRADMNKSPRHWYEDFLSPQNDDVKEKNAPTKFSFTAKNEVSRSLFSPLKASAAAKNGVPSKNGEETAAVVEELSRGTNKKFHHLPRKELDFDTPIERSDFSPPPSSVNILSLPIESEITFDSSSDMSESIVQAVPEGTTEEIPVGGNDDTTLSLNHVSKLEEGNLAVEKDTPFELEESNIVSEIGCKPGNLTLSQINVDESSIVKSEWSMSQELSNVEEISSNDSTIYEYAPMEEDGDAKDDKVGELDSVDKQSSVSEVAEMKDSEDYTHDDAVENSSSPKIASSSKSPVSDVVDSSTPKPTKTPKRLTPVPTPRATKTPDSTGESSDEMFSDYW